MFMDNTVDFEGSPQETALQRLWARRLTQTGCLVEEPEPSVLDDTFEAAAQDADRDKPCIPACDSFTHDAYDTLDQDWTKERRPRLLRLDGAHLGDLPARYVVPAVDAHEMPVVGVYVDPAVLPGFRYRVRPIETQAGRTGRAGGHLFGGRALELASIGRGYARRVTFVGDKLNHNDNYFWSDSHPNGYAFEIEAVSVGDKFTLFDANRLATGALEIVRLEGPQQEVAAAAAAAAGDGGDVEKRVRFRAIAKLEWFETQRAVVVRVSGTAVVRRSRGQRRATVTRVVEVAAGAHRGGLTLRPGVDAAARTTLVHGRAIGDVPASYAVVGLEAHEMPIIGTYVDARVTPGFSYRLRPAGSPRPLFAGRSMLLTGVGPGYAKRLTFASDVGRLNAGGNHLWSDSFPEGLGLETRAVEAGQRFHVTAAGVVLGEAVVLRADRPQREIHEERVSVAGRVTVIKHVQVDLGCVIALPSARDTDGAEPRAMRVSGRAVVARSSDRQTAELRRVEDVGLASHINLLFARQHAQLVFYPV